MTLSFFPQTLSRSSKSRQSNSAISQSNPAKRFFFLMERSVCGFRPINLTLPTAEKLLSVGKTRPKEAHCTCENGDDYAARH